MIVVQYDRSPLAARQQPQTDDRGLRVERLAAPLREQVLDIVRQAILDFRYEPGQRLIERELIEQIGVSRTTIREVLRELEAEGLVSTVPQKGAVVVVPSAEEAVELYEVRSALEQLAVRRFVERASGEEIVRLREASDHFAEAVAEGGDALSLLRAEGALYDVLFDGARNATARTIASNLQARVRTQRAASLSNSAHATVAVEELDVMVRSIERSEADPAAAAVARHLAREVATGFDGI